MRRLFCSLLGFTELSHSMSQRRVFVYGSIVLDDRMFVVFCDLRAKNDKREKRKYRSAEGSERQLRKSYLFRNCYCNHHSRSVPSADATQVL